MYFFDDQSFIRAASEDASHRLARRVAATCAISITISRPQTAFAGRTLSECMR